MTILKMIKCTLVLKLQYRQLYHHPHIDPDTLHSVVHDTLIHSHMHKQMPQTHYEINIHTLRVMFMVWVKDKRQLWSRTQSEWEADYSFTVYTPLFHMYLFLLSGLVSNFSISLYIYSPFKISRSVSNCSLLPAVSTFHSISSFFAFSLEADVTDWNSWQIKRRTFQYLGWIQTVYQWQEAAAEQKWGDKRLQSSLRAKVF